MMNCATGTGISIPALRPCTTTRRTFISHSPTPIRGSAYAGHDHGARVPQVGKLLQTQIGVRFSSLTLFSRHFYNRSEFPARLSSGYVAARNGELLRVVTRALSSTSVGLRFAAAKTLP